MYHNYISLQAIYGCFPCIGLYIIIDFRRWADHEQGCRRGLANRAYYGYKIHAATDSRDGFVLGGHATPANRSDTEEFVAVLDEVDAKVGESILADKGYSSQLNRYVLQVRGLTDGIMHKAARNRELASSEKNANRQISSVRAKVERAFGTLKRGYGFHRARYLGRAKVELDLLNAMAFNLKKAVLKAAC